MITSVHSSRLDNAGFSAVELLITLFIGALFLLGGYQLWAYVQRNGIEADYFAKASNVAYDGLQNYVPSCTTTTSPTELESVKTAATEAGLSGASATVETSCPVSTTTGAPTTLVRVKVTVSYQVASETRSASHAAIRNI